jgi:hypothetical protein
MPAQLKEIFVFGSNLAGIHGAGSAKEAAKNWGAQYGWAIGLCGSSYAIPTKSRRFRTLPLISIKGYVLDFLLFATGHPEMHFTVVAIGCGLAGYRPCDIAPMFRDAPPNVVLPKEFQEVLFGN